MDTDFYPVQENLVRGADTGEETVFLVDVGGGKGHDLQELHQKHPKLPRQLVLQDQPDVLIDATGLDSKIRLMEHDFFTPQPIKGTVLKPEEH